MIDDGPAQVSELLMTTWSDSEAAMVRQILATYGIPCQVVSHVPHTVLPFTMDGLGEVRILVPASRVRDARELLAEHRRQGLEIVDDAEPPSDDAMENEDDEAPGDVEATER